LRRPGPGSPNAVFRPGPQPVPKLELGDRSAGSVGCEARERHAVRVPKPQLGSRTWPFRADEQPHSPRSAIHNGAGAIQAPSRPRRWSRWAGSRPWRDLQCVLVDRFGVRHFDGYDSQRPCCASQNTSAWVPSAEPLQSASAVFGGIPLRPGRRTAGSERSSATSGGSCRVVDGLQLPPRREHGGYWLVKANLRPALSARTPTIPALSTCWLKVKPRS
jgi:hypothetical protein